MHDVWALRGPLEVVEPAYERDNRVWVVGNAKVRPACIVELLHFTTIIALVGGWVGQGGWGEGSLAIHASLMKNFQSIVVTV